MSGTWRALPRNDCARPRLAPFQLRHARTRSQDFQVGRLLNAVDELGLANDTVVVFSSDHGPEEPSCGDPSTHGGVADFGSTGCARGDKHTFLDGGIKIPFIVRYPGHVPAGESACTTSHVDILPTVCALAGIKAPKPIDGTSVLDVWLNRRTQSSPSCSNRTKPLLWAGHQDMVASNGRHKLWHAKSVSSLLHRLQLNASHNMLWRSTQLHHPASMLLFDVLNDPAEMHPLNLTGGMKYVANGLRAQLESWMCRHCTQLQWQKLRHPPFECGASKGDKPIENR